MLLNANKSFHEIGSIKDVEAILGIQTAMPEAEFRLRLNPKNPSVIIPYGREMEKHGSTYVLSKALGTIAKGSMASAASSITEDAASLSAIHTVEVAATSVTAANMAIEQNKITVTLPTLPAAIFKDEFYLGRIIVHEGTGQGDMYIITGNSAGTAAGTADFYVTPNVLTAASTDTELWITRNPYRGTLISGASGVNIPLGGAMAAADTTNNVYWVCREGWGPATADTALTHAVNVAELTSGTSVAGFVEVRTTLDRVVAHMPRFANGTSQINIADTETFPVFWVLPNMS